MSDYVALPQDEDDLETAYLIPDSTNKPVVDITSLDQGLKRWLAYISDRRKSPKGKLEIDEDSLTPIHSSVFTPTLSLPAVPQRGLSHSPSATHEDLQQVLHHIRAAIAQSQHPKLNNLGSSGSYFCKSLSNETLAIFKPKDEEPYGALNPKWTKWLHRNLLSFSFGRACLIPNLSYVSESAASLLDERLAIGLVPRTEVVELSSSAFFYDWMDRRAEKKGKALPVKEGSLQLFAKGFVDASAWLEEHPWPASDGVEVPQGKRRGFSCFREMKKLCGTTGAVANDDEEEEEDVRVDEERVQAEKSHRFQWTDALMLDFRQQLEKLVVLDYLMRNTDRGLDNFMIKYCEAESKSTSKSNKSDFISHQPGATATMSQLVPDQTDLSHKPHFHLAAIDNSLAFPHHHPRGWRAFPYGWLFLPSTLIGQPWSEATKNHFLPLLTDPKWWEETTFQLRTEFRKDSDYNSKMFSKQLSVLKGQAYNLVQSLKSSEEGPLELCARPSLLIIDDLIQVIPTVEEVSPKSHARIPSESNSLFSPLSKLKRSISERRKVRVRTSSISSLGTPALRHAASYSRSSLDGGSISGYSLMERSEILARMEEDDNEESTDRRQESSGSTGTQALPEIGEEPPGSEGVVGFAERIEEVNAKPFFVRY